VVGRHLHSAAESEQPLVVLVPSKRKHHGNNHDSVQGCKKVKVSAWLMNYCKPEAGNVQHRTDDVFDHVQEKCEKDVFLEYVKEHPGCDNIDSALSERISKSTFYSTLASCNKDGLVNLKFDRWCAMVECCECTALKILGHRTSDARLKAVYNAKLDFHNFCARCEQLVYEVNIENGMASPFERFC
jgi:hypothetical protein